MVAPPSEPHVQPPEPVNSTGVPREPAESTGVRRSKRVRTQTKNYTPSFKGSKHAVAVQFLEFEENMAKAIDSLASGEVIHPDAHLSFFHHLCENEPDVVSAIMTQMSLKAGLKAWGAKAEDAAYGEMKQLHFRDTFCPVHWKDLTEEQRSRILEFHLFLKLKRDVTVKGRTVAGGNKQRDHIGKEEASSPTVATESVMLTAVIEAQESHDVAIIDVPNAFIQTRVEDPKDRVLIRIRGVLVDMLLKIAPGCYDAHVTVDKKGVKQLIVECQNAIYGTMVQAFFTMRSSARL